MFKILLVGLSLGLFREDSFDIKRRRTADLCKEFKQMTINIREESISPDSARKCFRLIMSDLKRLFPSKGDSLNARLLFPLKGYNYRAVGGKGNGYRAKGFDLFDHSKKASHPAHDIFIRDLDQDSKDDNTQKPVDLLAVRDAIVLATETNWKPDSDYRGGNIVWLYDPELEGLFYYAHTRTIEAEVGHWVQAGDKIGEVGRTGFNAAKPRSGTHLHFVYLQIDRKTNLPKPINTYNWLKDAAVLQ